MAEFFDAALAEMRAACEWPRLGHTGVDFLTGLANRLSAAHEAEVAERDARIADLQAALYRWVPHADYGQQAADDATLLMGMTECPANEPGESVRQRADRAVGLLRSISVSDGGGVSANDVEGVNWFDARDAFLSEQAGERENATKDSAHED